MTELEAVQMQTRTFRTLLNFALDLNRARSRTGTPNLTEWITDCRIILRTTMDADTEYSRLRRLLNHALDLEEARTPQMADGADLLIWRLKCRVTLGRKAKEPREYAATPTWMGF